MSNTLALSKHKNVIVRAGIGSAAAFALVIGGIAVSANAATNTYGPFHEGDNAMPLSVTEGLVFSKNADLGVIVDPTWGVTTSTPLTPLSDVESLSYTVDSSVSTSTPVAPVAYAPSYQLVVYADRNSQTQKYTRLVWEPYMQSPVLNASDGAYTNVQDGLWWTSKIDNPAPGSQSSPQHLAFFEDDGAAGWANVHIGAVAIHQGSTSDVTSVVSDVTYNGTHLQLGNVDTTPFDQADIDAATAPLDAQIAGLTSQLSGANGQITDLTLELATANGDITDLQGELTVKQGQLATAQTQLANAQTELADAQDDNAALLETISTKLDQIVDLQDQISDLQDELETAQANADALEDELASTQADLATSQDDLATTTVTLSSVQAQFATYKLGYQTKNGSSIGTSRATLASVPAVGKTVSVKLEGTIAKSTTPVKYQWYVSGHPVTNATKATFKVPATAKGHTVTVKVTGEYKHIVFGVTSNGVISK